MSDKSNKEIQEIENYLMNLNAIHLSYKVQPLTADASHRKYFRLEFQGESREKNPFDHCSTVVFCKDEKLKPMDEIFLLHELFNKSNIRTPKIFHYKNLHELKSYFLEDIGDVPLKAVPKERRLEYYKKTIEQMVSLQSIDLSNELECKSILERSFDHNKILYELNFFKQHFIENNRLKISLNEKDSVKIEEFFSMISEHTVSNKVLCHRDFHSKNIFVKDSKVYFIDYQDAMMGSWAYDLCSLLEDPYAEIDDLFKTELIKFYFDLRAKKIDEKMLMEYSWVSLQRLIKAAGSYTYLTNVMGKDEYRKYINIALERSLTFSTICLKTNNIWPDLLKSLAVPLDFNAVNRADLYTKMT